MISDYPPGVVLHAPHCPEAGDGNAPGLDVRQAIAAYPSYQLCGCAGGSPDTAPYVVVEQINYGIHLYVPAGARPDDATRPLCKTCRGTHGTLPAGLVIPGA